MIPASRVEASELTDQAHSAPVRVRWTQWLKALEIGFALCAAAPIALFLAAALRRLHYPYALEQLEGPMLLAAERVAHGLPVYVRPNFHFIPYMYAPAYYYVSGWAVRMLGPGFFPLRLVSLLSVCASFAIIGWLITLDATGNRQRRALAALAGMGMYASAYPWTRSWFDLGRVDSLYIFLLLLALLCTRLTLDGLNPVLAAFAWTLAFLAKQTILPVALLVLCFNWRRPRSALLGAGSCLAMALASVMLLDRATGGWFRFYVFTVPRANADLLLRPAVFYVPSQIIAPFGAALLIIAASCVAWPPVLRAPRTRLYLLAGGSTLGLCWFLQAHGGATANTPMPAYAVLAVLFGLSFARLDLRLAGREPARVLLLAAAAIPLVSWIYNPRDMMPKQYIAAAHDRRVAWIRQFAGDVYEPSNPYETVLAGKPWHPDVAALHDSLAAASPGLRQQLVQQIGTAINSAQFSAILLDAPAPQALAAEPWLPSNLQKSYPVVGLIPDGASGSGFSADAVYFLLPCREQELAISRGWTLLTTGTCPQQR